MTYRVQRVKPAQMTSPYRLRREMYCPERMDAMDCIASMGMVMAADSRGGHCRTFWKYSGR